MSTKTLYILAADSDMETTVHHFWSERERSLFLVDWLVRRDDPDHALAVASVERGDFREAENIISLNGHAEDLSASWSTKEVEIETMEGELVRVLGQALRVFNSKKVEPLRAFLVIEQMRAVMEKAKKGGRA